MSAENAVKEVVRIATTAGLSKDVIDLMEKKLALLTAELSQANTRISKFEIENRQLKTQIQNSQPVTGNLHSAFGVLWKRAGNGFERVPYCPQCENHPAMFGQPPHPLIIDPHYWQCSKCDFLVNFSGRPK